jgi:hypothetical protein
MDITRHLEKANFSFDVERLQLHIQEHVVNHDPTMLMGDVWGGWSVWSGTGFSRDGFQISSGATFMSDDNGAFSEDQSAVASWLQTVPTEICSGYLADVMNEIKKRGLYPCRARIARLVPNSASSWHRDCPAERYMVRLHIPIFTNEKCLFFVEDEDTKEQQGMHLPADGTAWFVSTNIIHRITNDGQEDRLHLLMDVTDKYGFSKYHSISAHKAWCAERNLTPAFFPVPDLVF